MRCITMWTQDYAHTRACVCVCLCVYELPVVYVSVPMRVPLCVRVGAHAAKSTVRFFWSAWGVLGWVALGTPAWAATAYHLHVVRPGTQFVSVA